MKRSDEKRLDILVMEKTGLSRNLARDMIEDGRVLVNGNIKRAPGHKFPPEAIIETRLPDSVYVSRGGFKLERALDAFSIDVKGCICLDIGASTGGFTDCLLKRGAALVYAVDTGSGQLAERLRQNPGVVSMEKTNINDVETLGQGPEALPDLAVADVSFVSLTKILEKMFDLLNNESMAVCLIKPQFEAGRANVSKKGVVLNTSVHQRVLMDIYDFSIQTGFDVLNLVPSPIKGGDGNKEYLIHLLKTGDKPDACMDRKSFAAVAGKVVSGNIGEDNEKYRHSSQ